MELDRTKYIRLLICQCKSLKENIARSLADVSSKEVGRYVSFRTYAGQFDNLADNVCEVLNIDRRSFAHYNYDKLSSWGDTLWPQQRLIMESVLMSTDMLLSYLQAETEFSDDEFGNLENFFKTKLRSSIFSKPQKEKEVQDAIETLLIGKGWNKGIDYDRETGKVEFSGKEYIPDFIIPKLKLCIEVKLLREGKKSQIIEEINSDITGYGKKYNRQLFIVYDLGVIRDELEFRRDIENAGDSIRVVIIKQ